MSLVLATSEISVKAQMKYSHALLIILQNKTKLTNLIIKPVLFSFKTWTNRTQAEEKNRLKYRSWQIKNAAPTEVPSSSCVGSQEIKVTDSHQSLRSLCGFCVL